MRASPACSLAAPPACLPLLRQAASTPRQRGTFGRDLSIGHARLSLPFRAPSSLRAGSAAPRRSSSPVGAPRDASRGEARPDGLPVAARQRRTPEAQAEGGGGQ
jgi:hypothetical protein